MYCVHFPFDRLLVVYTPYAFVLLIGVGSNFLFAVVELRKPNGSLVFFCSQRTCNGGLGMPDLASHRFAKSLAFSSRPLMRDSAKNS